MNDVTVTILKDGPLLVKGLIQIRDATGKPVAPREPTDTVALCRCGHSGTKPFCDGAHKPANFKG